MGRGAARGWKEMRGPRGEMLQPVQGWGSNKEKRQVVWPSSSTSPSGPSEAVRESRERWGWEEEEEESPQGDPQESFTGPWSSTVLPLPGCVSLDNHPLCASRATSLLCSCSGGSPELMPVGRLVQLLP